MAIDQDRLSKEFNKIRNLRQYKNYNEEQLRRVAIARTVEYLIDIESLFEDSEEKKVASDLVKEYIEHFTPENISDLNTLRSIIFLEMTAKRLQNIANKKYKEDNQVDLSNVKMMNETLTKIVELKEVLGITGDKKLKMSDGQKIFESLKKQFEVWRENNQASRTMECPYCKQMVLLKIRTDVWEASRHPFFKDKVLYNKHLLDLFLRNVVTKDDISKILECSPDYIDWLLNKWKTNKDYKEISKEIEKNDSSIVINDFNASTSTVVTNDTLTNLPTTDVTVEGNQTSIGTPSNDK
jgi:DNA-directed RNA polymerase subunit RPC12/RpoP